MDIITIDKELTLSSETYENKVTFKPKDNQLKSKLFLGKNMNFKNGAIFEDLDITFDFNEIKVPNPKLSLMFKRCNLNLEKKDYQINFTITIIECSISEINNINFIDNIKVYIRNTNIKCKDISFSVNRVTLINTKFLQSSIICENFENKLSMINIIGYLLICSKRLYNTGTLVVFPAESVSICHSEESCRKELKNYSSTIIAKEVINDDQFFTSEAEDKFSSLITSNSDIINKAAINKYIINNDKIVNKS